MKDKKSIIVAGGRDFNDYEYLKKTLTDIVGDDSKFIFEIVSGGARGADALGEQFAHEHFIQLKIFPAEWDKYGKSAGYRRNKQMAEYANACVVFWDGKSKGTEHMINLATEYGLPLLVKKYKV